MDDIAQGPSCHDVDAHPLVLKWLHTIVHDPTYLSEWAAIDQARHLAWTLGGSLPVILPRIMEMPKPISVKPVRKHVNFAEEVDVCIFSDVSPFSFASHVNHSKVHATILTGIANFANFALPQKGMTDEQTMTVWPINQTSVTDKGAIVWHLISSGMFDHEGTAHDHVLPESFDPAAMHLQSHIIKYANGHEAAHASNCEGSQRTTPTADNSSPVVYPDFRGLDKVPFHSFQIQQQVRINDAKPPIQQYRLDHQSPLDTRDESDAQTDDEQETPGEDDGNDRGPYLPAFARRLEALLRARNLHPDDGDFDLPVRTWYINHNTVHRWTSPRILQLVGQPHTWEAQITSLWIDQIDDQDWYDVVVVQPDPPRIPRHHFVALDLIVTQYSESTRQPGLITVLPTRPEIGDMYAVALSFP